MHLTNLHTHTVYCDGKNTTEEMIQAAIKNNFYSIGISSHGPVNFITDWNIQKHKVEKYIAEVLFLKEKYRDKIDVFLGMELDYIPRVGFDGFTQELIKRLDYYVGSVHFMGMFCDKSMWTVDYKLEELIKGVNENFNGDLKYAVEVYYNLISEMVERFQPPIIGHMDLIKKFNNNNILFNEGEEWYISIVEKCLNSIKKTKCVIEINTGGISRGYSKEQYPSTFILKMIMEKDIPITINSDAHSIEGINCKFAEMYELVKSIGFGNISCMTKNGWTKIQI
jgi:histidinol-phosphatase (PHP family)